MRIATLLLTSLLLVGCGSSSGESSGASEPPDVTPSSGSPSPTSTPSPRVAPGAKVTTFDSDYGPMLFDDSGQAIYLFQLESTSKPRCYDECAEAWPPVLTRGEPVARGQVDASLLGTVARKDGTTQVTYDGHPLYFYAHEGKRQVLCHNIEEYGGLWLVVQPDGKAAPA